MSRARPSSSSRRGRKSSTRQHADRVTAFHLQRYAGVVADAGRAGDQRIVPGDRISSVSGTSYTPNGRMAEPQKLAARNFAHLQPVRRRNQMRSRSDTRLISATGMSSIEAASAVMRS